MEYLDLNKDYKEEYEFKKFKDIIYKCEIITFGIIIYIVSFFIFLKIGDIFIYIYKKFECK